MDDFLPLVDEFEKRITTYEKKRQINDRNI